MRRIAVLLSVLAFALVSAPWPGASAAEEVNLYSYREPALIKPILDEFTRQTAIKVNSVYVDKGMLERLKAEGTNSPADAVLTVDVGRLEDMAEAGVLQPIKSAAIDRNIPAQYRHPDGLWVGLTTRARVFLVSKDRVKPGEIATYADLANPKLKGRICTRSGKHDYNVSLIAAMIDRHGEAAAKQWLSGVKANLARKPQGSDRSQAKAIVEGVCDVALLNTYYVGHMATNEKEPEQKSWVNSASIVFPDQAGRGAHVNISGAALTKSARNKAQAIRLVEFLSEDFAQKLYAELNFEFPVKPGAALHPLVASWGLFKADAPGLLGVAKHRAAASRLVDETGFDGAPGGS
ncbi:MAG: Fe(3+) ABC transporter substrate-binding protein [Rhodospirillales bacterium]|nr:Fe(3+) ABC transporter substrate-binding protein [Rhodospirillales bacterium]